LNRERIHRLDELDLCFWQRIEGFQVSELHAAYLQSEPF
jgi:hypothetical protein